MYPLTWALGDPGGVEARGTLTAQGVDLQNALTLTYDGGAHAQLTTSIGADCRSVVTISGTEGWLRSSGPLFNPGELVIQPRRGTLRTERFEVFGNGFSYGLREVTRCIQAGLTGASGRT